MAFDFDRLFAAVGRAPRLAGRGLVKAYRYTLSPLVGFHCRHLPTCSQYADEAISRFGLWAGGWMTLGRLCRCHPLGTAGLDFVPTQLSGRARWYLPWRYARWRGVNATPPLEGRMQPSSLGVGAASRAQTLDGVGQARGRQARDP